MYLGTIFGSDISVGKYTCDFPRVPPYGSSVRLKKPIRDGGGLHICYHEVTTRRSRGDHGGPLWSYCLSSFQPLDFCYTITLRRPSGPPRVHPREHETPSRAPTRTGAPTHPRGVHMACTWWAAHQAVAPLVAPGENELAT